MVTEYRVNLKGREQSIKARMIFTWRRTDPVIQLGPVSSSSGVKDYIKNDICALFMKDELIDAIYMVRAGGPPFLLIRKGKVYCDVTGAEVEVKLVKEEPVPNIRPADKLIA